MMNRMQFTLCGSYEDDERLNPYAVTKPEIRQEILSVINRDHLPLERLAEVLKLSEEDVAGHLQALKEAGLVEEVARQWKPSFAIFTVEDQQKLESLMAAMPKLYARVVRDNMAIVHRTYAACGFIDHGFSLAHLGYILVGAYVLDFGGLALEEPGFIMATKEMPGGAYVFTGFEGELRKLQSSWMWGHTSSFGPFTFLGHGELPPQGPRHAFPEQSYRWRAEGWTEEQVSRVMEEIGTILAVLYRTPMDLSKLARESGVESERVAEHLALLKKLDYVRDGELRTSVCPVVNAAAKDQIQKMVAEVWGKLLDEAVRPSWERLEHLYRGTAPARNGIDVCEAFNPIHHAIFEQALRLLMEGGVIAWPPQHADGARYAVWIEHAEDR